MLGDRPAAGTAASSWFQGGHAMSNARLRAEAARVLLALAALASIALALGAERKWGPF